MDLFTKSLILKEKEEKTGKLLLPGLLTGIIPEDLTTLEHLDTIIIQDSKCSKITFPSNLQKLTKLKNIHIHQTLITEIPEELFLAISITNLCLGGNKIEHISENICNLKNLRRLNLRNNKLSEIPKHIIKLNKLQEISLSQNQIKHIDK